MAELREKKVSPRKLVIVQGASFDTIIEALTSKSENAQLTFIHRFLSELNGEVLAVLYKYAESEIKRRAKKSVEPS